MTAARSIRQGGPHNRSAGVRSKCERIAASIALVVVKETEGESLITECGTTDEVAPEGPGRMSS